MTRQPQLTLASLWGSTFTFSITPLERDQPDAETSTWQHTTLTRDRPPSMPPAEFEPPIAASERPQTQTLDRAATGIESKNYMKQLNN
jgi:hypothetical protein